MPLRAGTCDLAGRPRGVAAAWGRGAIASSSALRRFDDRIE